MDSVPLDLSQLLEQCKRVQAFENQPQQSTIPRTNSQTSRSQPATGTHLPTDLIRALDSLKSEILKPVDSVPLDLSQLLEQCKRVQAFENQPQQSTIPRTNSQTSRSPPATGTPLPTDLIRAVDSLKSEILKPVDSVPLDLSQLLEQCKRVQAFENQPQKSTIPRTNSQTSRSQPATGTHLPTDLIRALDSLKSEILKPVDSVPLDLSQLLEQCKRVQAFENQPQQSTIPRTNSQTSRSPPATGTPLPTVTPLATVTSLPEGPMATSFDRYVSNLPGECINWHDILTYVSLHFIGRRKEYNHQQVQAPFMNTITMEWNHWDTHKAVSSGSNIGWGLVGKADGGRLLRK